MMKRGEGAGRGSEVRMKKALVVVDFQKDFVDGALGFSGAAGLDAVIAAKVERAMEEGSRIVFTLDTHSPGYLDTNEGRHLPVVHCIEGTEGWSLYGKTADTAREAEKKGAVFLKKGQFGSLELADLLKKGEFDEIEICGLVSNICVVSNALIAKAACPEARVVVDSNATSCFDPEANEAALNVMRSCQVEVV